MEHELIQEHDRALTTLQTEIKTIASDVRDIKCMIERLDRDHRSDDRAQASAMKDVQVEIATLKTRVYYISGAVGLAASILMKVVGG